MAGGQTVCVPAAGVCLDLADPCDVNRVLCDVEIGDPCGLECDDPCERNQGVAAAAGLCTDNVNGAECKAAALLVDVSPTLTAPTGVTELRSYSHAKAVSFGGFTSDFAEAHGAQQSVGTMASADVLSSGCSAAALLDSNFPFASASGRAATTDAVVTLYPLGVPVALGLTVLEETGFAAINPFFFGAQNNGEIIDGFMLVGSPPTFIPLGPNAVAKNTQVPIPGIGILYLNEEFVSVGPNECIHSSGDAARLVVTDPMGGALATVIVNWVSTGACPF